MDQQLQKLYFYVVGSVSFFGFFIYTSLRKIIKHYRFSRLINTIQQLTPDQLYQKLINTKQQKLNNQIITGFVQQSPSSIQNIINKDLVYKKKYQSNIISSLYDLTYGETVLINLDMVAMFNLKGQNSSVQIQRNNKVEIDDQLLAQIDSYYLINELDPMFQIFYPLALLFRSNQLYKGFKVGETYKELGIKVGTLMSVIGDVSYENGTMKVKNPFAFFCKKDNLLFIVKSKMVNYTFLLIIQLAVFGVVGYLFQSEIKKLKKIMQNKKPPEKRIKFDNLIQVTTKKSNNFSCLNCNRNLRYNKYQERSRIVFPCLHLSICQDCVNLEKCPQCQEDIKEILEVYIP